MYYPLNYEKINLFEGSYQPSMVKSYNNQAFSYWQRSLFQRISSQIIANNLPEGWEANVKDFLYYSLIRFGFVACWDDSEFGFVFNPASLKGYNFYYQPTDVVIANPSLKKSLELKIGEECELLKLTPDYRGIWDIICYYAEKLATLDNAINMSIINNKFAYVLGARNKGMQAALKKMLDKINAGEPAVILDQKIMNDTTDKDVPFQFLERSNLKQSYLTTDQLRDFQTLLNSFDAEIGIPTIPYEKKERMVTEEASSKVYDSTARAIVWINALNESAEVVNAHFGTSISFELRYDPERKESAEDGNTDNDRTV